MPYIRQRKGAGDKLEKQRISEVKKYLPQRISEMLGRLIETDPPDIEEVRLRVDAPLTVGIWGESCFVTPTGGITNHESDAYKVSSEEVRTAFRNVCENSVYAHLEEIRQGYITLGGGHRVGICGKAVCDGGKITTISEVSSLNFRIAHQIIGLADGIMDKIVEGSEVYSTLIIALPQMGKTTLLRDIIRQVSDRGFKCGVADDRGELAALYRGVPSNCIGAQTDVIDGAPKAEAIEMLLRTMSPKVIVSDEIASEADAAALRVAAGTGVRIIATTHGRSVEEAMRRRLLRPLFEDRIFSRAIVLHRDFSTPDSVTYTEAVTL